MKIDKQALDVLENAKWYNSWIINYVRKYIKGNVLEIGAGSGTMSELLLSITNDLTLIDINSDHLQLLKNKFKKRKIKIGYGNPESGKYFFSSKKYDTVILINVLEHIEDDNNALLNIFKLLKDNGNLIILVPAYNLLMSKFDKNIGHHRRYTIHNLKQKIEKGHFSISDLRYINWLGAIGWFIFMKIMGKQTLPKYEVLIFNIIAKYLIFIEKYIKPPFGLSVIAVAKKSL